MFDRSDEKLKRVKERLQLLVSEFDLLLQDARALSNAGRAQNSPADDPDWILQIVEQREVLATVVAIIADSNIDSKPLAGNN